MKDLTTIKNTKSTSRILLAVSVFLLIFGLASGDIGIVTTACCVGYYAYGKLDYIVRLYEKHSKP